MQTVSFLSLITNLSVKLSYCKKTDLFKNFIHFQKDFPVSTRFGAVLANLGVLGHFEAKKCANWLNFFPDFKFENKTVLQ